MLTKEQKIKLIEEAAEKAKQSQAVLMVDFTGLKVAKINELRKSLLGQGMEMKVLKKTLIIRSLILAGVKNADIYSFPGPAALIFSPEEGNVVAKEIYNFGRQNKDVFKILGGIISGSFVEADKIVFLAKLPSREILLGQLLSVFNSLPQALVGVLSGVNRKLVIALDRISKK